jgi:hypothetical protein
VFFVLLYSKHPLLWLYAIFYAAIVLVPYYILVERTVVLNFELADGWFIGEWKGDDSE